MMLNPAKFSTDRYSSAGSVLIEWFRPYLRAAFDRCAVQVNCGGRCCVAQIPTLGPAAAQAGRILARRRRLSAGERERCEDRCEDCCVPGVSLHWRSPEKVQTGCYKSVVADEMRRHAKTLLFCVGGRAGRWWQSLGGSGARPANPWVSLPPPSGHWIWFKMESWPGIAP